MSGPHDPFSFDAEFGDPDYGKSARDPNLPPQTGKEWVDCRASDIPVTEGGECSPFADLDDEFGTSDAPASQERTGERAGTDDQARSPQRLEGRRGCCRTGRFFRSSSLKNRRV